jgi:hypothetical protein
MKPLDHLSICSTNAGRPQRVLIRAVKSGVALLGLSVLLAGSTVQAQTRAERRDSTRALEPLIGRRVLVVLPLQTSQNWSPTGFHTGDFAGNSASSGACSHHTGRYSVAATNRFNRFCSAG